ncbi:hypothetical protein IW262DRAFT_1302049 [Armillaria fumosa]|nr:hypothetical protein IW262DRAFT_1302049 [Armillaria fumosa]
MPGMPPPASRGGHEADSASEEDTVQMQVEESHNDLVILQKVFKSCRFETRVGQREGTVTDNVRTQTRQIQDVTHRAGPVLPVLGDLGTGKSRRWGHRGNRRRSKGQVMPRNRAGVRDRIEGILVIVIVTALFVSVSVVFVLFFNKIIHGGPMVNVRILIGPSFRATGGRTTARSSGRGPQDRHRVKRPDICTRK